MLYWKYFFEYLEDQNQEDKRIEVNLPFDMSIDVSAENPGD